MSKSPKNKPKKITRKAWAVVYKKDGKVYAVETTKRLASLVKASYGGEEETPYFGLTHKGVLKVVPCTISYSL